MRSYSLRNLFFISVSNSGVLLYHLQMGDREERELSNADRGEIPSLDLSEDEIEDLTSEVRY